MADVHEQMKDGGGESGEEDGQRRNLLFRRSAFAQEEGKSDKETKQQGREHGVTIGAVKVEEGGGPEIRTRQIDVGDGSCNEHGNRGGARKARKGGAPEGVGGQGMGEGIHGKSYLTESDAASVAVTGWVMRVVRLAGSLIERTDGYQESSSLWQLPSLSGATQRSPGSHLILCSLYSIA